MNIPRYRYYESQLAIIEDTNLAEAEFRFVGIYDNYKDFQKHLEGGEKLSIAEYIYKYAFYQFIEYLEKEYNLFCRVDIYDILRGDKKF